jgi:replicative DNA helicase
VALDEHVHRLAACQVTAFHDQGVQPVVELTTRLGRTLRCTPTHPVLTPDGWKRVGDLIGGDRIAAPRSLPFFGTEPMREHEVKLLAYVLSDGAAQSDTNVTSALVEVAEDLEGVAAGFGLELRVYSKPRNRARLYRLVRPRGARARARQRFAGSLRAVQQEAGLSTAEWARHTGIDYNLLHAWRRADCVPSAEQAAALAKVVGVEPGTFEVHRSPAEMTTEAARLLQKAGVRFRTAAEKSVPDCVFGSQPTSSGCS